jgi:uncharacterized membrane protein YbaN (DUF454 family)
MKPEALDATHATGLSGSGQRGSQPHPVRPDIAIDEDAGSIRVSDPRAFRAERRAFCRRLIAAATGRPGVRKAEIDLASAACKISFGPGAATTARMANAFADSVREAAAGSSGTDGTHTPWWRPAENWSILTVYPHGGAGDGAVSIWETRQQRPGRMRLYNQRLAGDRGRLDHLAEMLAGLENVAGCRVSPWSRTVTLEFRPERPLGDRILDEVERILEDALAGRPVPGPGYGPREDAERATPEVATGLTRLKYLALAGGAFALTLVALVVPGIPTVPCLLATSYYLARSSPRLDMQLRQTAFIGPILTEWEQHHALGPASKGKLIGLTFVLIVVTVVVTPLTPVALVLILVAVSLSIYEITRLPGLPDPQVGSPQHGVSGNSSCDLVLSRTAASL